MGGLALLVRRQGGNRPGHRNLLNPTCSVKSGSSCVCCCRRSIGTLQALSVPLTALLGVIGGSRQLPGHPRRVWFQRWLASRGVGLSMRAERSRRGETHPLSIGALEGLDD